MTGLARPLLVFFGILIFGQIFVAILQSFLDLGSAAVGASIGLAMAAAGGAGTSFAGTEGRMPTAREKFVFALVALFVGSVVALATFWGIFAWLGMPFTIDNIALAAGSGPQEAADFRSYLPLVLIGAAVVNLLIVYIGFGLGARSALKRGGQTGAS
jgi:hypothetical protein